MGSARSLYRKRTWLLFAALMALILSITAGLFLSMDDPVRDRAKPFVYVLLPFIVAVYFAARCLASLWTHHSVRSRRRPKAGVSNASE